MLSEVELMTQIEVYIPTDSGNFHSPLTTTILKDLQSLETVQRSIKINFSGFIHDFFSLEALCKGKKFDILKYYYSQHSLSPLLDHSRLIKANDQCHSQFKRGDAQVSPRPATSLTHPCVGH